MNNSGRECYHGDGGVPESEEADTSALRRENEAMKDKQRVLMALGIRVTRRQTRLGWTGLSFIPKKGPNLSNALIIHSS